MSKLHIPYAEISNITLFVLGNNDNQKDSFVDIKYQDASKHNTPYPNGVYDLHMGTTDLEFTCLTCQHGKRLCPGHPGRLDLKYPVQSPLFLKEIQKWLKCICFACGKPILGMEKLDAIIEARVPKFKILDTYLILTRSVKNLKCPSCGTLHPHVTKDRADNISLFIEWYETKTLEAGNKPKLLNKKPIQLFPHEIEAIFNRITNETVQKFGKPIICHPKKYILRKLRAPPNTIRPDLKKIGSGRSNNNDVTVLLQNIIKVNQNFPDEIPPQIDTESDLAKDIHLLELHVYEMIKGSSSLSKRGLSNNSKKPLVSIAKRLPRKVGRIRRNLMGRRANHMARSFITCDPGLRIDEIGVPLIIAQTLDIPIHVRPYNYEQCMIYFMNGDKRYPGCKKIKKKSTGNIHSITQIKEDFKLEIGDIIYRDLIEDDIVDFNRQPSLEPSSISSMKVKIMYESHTIRLNVTACPLFNADFDGDAMNIIVPRSSRTINEVAQLASPKQRFISYKNGSPIMGEAQDSLVGMAELTRTKTKMDKLHAMRMFSNIPVYHDFSALPFDHIYTGREVVSALFCETGMLINFNRTAKYYDKILAPYRNYDPLDIKVEIDRGVLKTGILDKSSIGEGVGGGIFHIIHNQYGARAAIETSFQLQQFALTYLFNRGITVSIRDLLIPRKAIEEIHDIESSLIAESIQITDKLNQGKIVAPLGKTIEEHYEALQKEALNPGDKLWPPLFTSIDVEYNCFDKLIMYGSKGKLENFRNISTAVGQIEINGERMKENFGRRAIAYFMRYDPDPGSRGHISNSYMSGLSVSEFFFHAQDNRYQLINKALSTSITGMYNRMAVKNLESHIIDNMRRVNKSGRIIQLLYGADGVDPRFLEKVFVPIAKADLNEKLFHETFHGASTLKILGIKPTTALTTALDAEYDQLCLDRKQFIDIYLKREPAAGRIYQEETIVPIHVKRIIDDTLYNLGLKTRNASDLNPLNTIAAVRTLCSNLVYCLLNEIQERKQSPVAKYMQVSTTILKILVRSYLNVATLVRMGVTNAALEIITRQIKYTYIQSLISYGTAVGIIAAQSISEPLTQMVLDSHHSSGVASTKKKGMERVREILNAKPTDKMKAPSMNIFVKSEYHADRTKVQEIANHIEMLIVSQFTKRWDIFYEAYGKPEHPDYVDEARLIKEFEKYNVIKPPSDLVNWCIRLSINKLMLIEKQITMDSMYSAIRKAYPFTHVIYTTDNSENMFMRIYARNTISKKGDLTVDQMRTLTHRILSTTIRGIDGINAAYVKETTRNFLQPDGAIKSSKIYYIFTDGTNLRGVLMNPYVDRRLVQSDSIQETKTHFGIEEGRSKDINELIEQVGDSASYRHFTMYSDEKTYTGNITSIDRYGSAKRDTSFMLRISDASPISVIENSAINALGDTLEGVSPPIMIGKNPHIGDLYNTFKIDEQFVIDNTQNLEKLLDDL